jgi:arylsulfatase A-like enzyme
MAAMSVTAICASTGFSVLPERTAARPDIVLVAFDTARLDLFNAEWESLCKSPAFAPVRDRATRYTRAVTPAVWTMPAIASALTGRDVWSHGLEAPELRLSDRIPYLPEMLAESGYACALSTYNPTLAPRSYSRLDSGFESVEWSVVEFEHRAQQLAIAAGRAPLPYDARLLDRRAMQRVCALDPHRPRFQLINWMDAHFPTCTVTDEGRLAPHPVASWEEHLYGHAPLDDTAIALMRSGHAEGIRRMLLRFAALIREIEATRRPTRVVLFADHGDLLGEAGLVGHVVAPGPELYQVPLVTLSLNMGRSTPRQVSTPVILNDLFDTVLGWAGLPLPPGIDRPRFHSSLTLDAAPKPDAPQRTFALWFSLPSSRMGDVLSQVRRSSNPRAAARAAAALEKAALTVVTPDAMTTFDSDHVVTSYARAADGTFGSKRTIDPWWFHPVVDAWLEWRMSAPRPPRPGGDTTTERPIRTTLRAFNLIDTDDPPPG